MAARPASRSRRLALPAGGAWRWLAPRYAWGRPARRLPPPLVTPASLGAAAPRHRGPRPRPPRPPPPPQAPPPARAPAAPRPRGPRPRPWAETPSHDHEALLA